MAHPPAVIIVVRHGARLDAADKSWHLTSPTPYDPPLTYGGWTQSRLLGLRIASLLHAREESASGDVPGEPHELTNKHVTAVAPEILATRRGRRKHKVYIHSSPFQRCVQTGVGISAGISQFHGTVVARVHNNESRPTSAWEARPSPRLHAVDATVASVVAKSNLRKSLRDGHPKAKLRIDACLGEWLSPDYFDLITPPPNSNMMVTGAKGELMRRAEGLDSYSNQSARGASGNLWSSSRTASNPATPDENEILDMHQLLPSLPERDRTSSFNSGRVKPFGRPAVARGGTIDTASAFGYSPPIPGYAVAPSEPIPRGYVAHARDACLDIDLGWDSQRDPLSWGDGGEYGEEWSAMHKRFRKGLLHMVGFYGDHPDGEVNDDHVAVAADSHHDEADSDEETVLVIVTHGAGCNALIGGLTEQPVLLDIGMASLTMAVRKPALSSNNGAPLLEGRTSPETTSDLYNTARRGSRAGIAITTGLSELYDMKYVASTEHLRPGADPSRPSTPNTSAPNFAAAKTIPESRRRSTLLSHANSGAPIETAWSLGEHARGTTSSALGSIRRSSGQGIVKTQRSNSTSSGTSTGGLWAPSTPPLTVAREEDVFSLIDKNDSPSGSVILDPAKTHESTTNESEKLGIQPAATNRSQLFVPSTPARSKSDDPSTIPRISMTSPSPRREEADSVSELPQVGSNAPAAIGRTLSQKGLWGSAVSGIPERDRGPKRRWTLQQQE